MSSVNLAALAAQLAAVEDPGHAGELIVEAVITATGAAGARVYLVHRSEGVLVCLASKGGSPPEKRLAFGEGTLPGLALQRQSTVQAGTELAVPLFFGERGVGVLAAEGVKDPVAAEQEMAPLGGVVALALAHLMVRQEMLEQWRFLEVITTLNWLITSGLESFEFYDALHQLIKGLVEFDWMKVLVKEGNRINVLAFFRDGEAVPPEEAAHASDLALQARFLSGQPDTVEDLRAAPDLAGDSVLVAEGLRAILLAPLLTRQGVIGGLCFYSRKTGKYTEHDFPLAQQLAGQLAMTIENALLIREMSRKNQEIEESHRRLATINAIAETLTRSLELEEVLREVLAKVMEVINWDAGVVFLRQEEEKGFVFAVHRGLPVDYVASLTESRRSRDKVSNVPVRFSFPEEIAEFDATNLPGGLDASLFSAGSFQFGVVVPLKHKDEIRGVLLLFRRTRQRLNEGERKVLEAVGNQIGVAVENARLYQKVKTMAERDALTGLYNRHKFFAVLEAELKRCSRHQSKCGVLLFDVDHFKDYNDTFGHLAGDECLRKTGRIIQQSIRETDTAARYGGEEFVALVVEADARNTIGVAERLRRRLEAEGQKEPFPTVSVGVAVYPDDGLTAQELLLTADNALYTAKRMGRNRTVWRGMVQTPA
uniref:Diguanylate cyclase n=1 Tax=Ammonifex degensii TaxID=42838 RepID=A0A7C2EII9_9THEO